MKISEITLRNFKRFKNTRVVGLPEQAKLVLLVGPNGSGKSSLFDGLYQWYRMHTGRGVHQDEAYYRKDRAVDFSWHQIVSLSFHGVPSSTTLEKKCMYFRTAYRNDPDFNVTSFSRIGAPQDDIRFNRLIDNDQTVAHNYQRLVYNTLGGVYSEAHNEWTVKQLREDLIGRIQKSMRNVFADLVLNNIGHPLDDGAFLFEKGTSKSYHYKNLSGGEKAAFDLLLDLIIKIQNYDDTVFIIDEPETHMHTSLQGRLVKELFSIIPDNSQLWLTTHQLGVMNAARDIEKDYPGSVVVLDFDGNNFDEECTISPVKIDRIVWEKFLSISLGDFSARVSPQAIYLCEGSLDGVKRKNFDPDILNRIFGGEYPDVTFIAGGGCADLEKDDHIGHALLKQVLKSASIYRLLDRDDKSAEEVRDRERNGFVVLGRRHLESYLFDDEIITTLATMHGAKDQQATLEVKAQAISNSTSRGNPQDDIKSAAGEIYNGLKTLLSLTNCGNNTDAFMRDTLAPLITSETAVYKELKAAIFKV